MSSEHPRGIWGEKETMGSIAAGSTQTEKRRTLINPGLGHSASLLVQPEGLPLSPSSLNHASQMVLCIRITCEALKTPTSHPIPDPSHQDHRGPCTDVSEAPPVILACSQVLKLLSKSVFLLPSPLHRPWEDRASCNLHRVESALQGEVQGRDRRPACQLLALQTPPPAGLSAQPCQAHSPRSRLFQIRTGGQSSGPAGILPVSTFGSRLRAVN